MQYGLIGRTLGYSFSERYFSDKFAREGLVGYRYRNFELETIADLPGLLSREPELAGFNVTIPYKREVIRYLDRMDAEAVRIGAVNTVVRANDGRLVGHNTDVVGFRQTLDELDLGSPPPDHPQSFDLVFGTGGASEAVVYVLTKLGRAFRLVSRSPRDGQLAYEQLLGLDWSLPRLLVNTTPVGTHPAVDDILPIPVHRLGPQHTVVDLIYNPLQTALLKVAANAGAQTANGLPMLVGQADAAWSLWQANGHAS